MYLHTYVGITCMYLSKYEGGGCWGIFFLRTWGEYKKEKFALKNTKQGKIP